MKKIFTDWDGYEYFRNESGRMVDKNGHQISLSEEHHVSQILSHQLDCARHREGRIGKKKKKKKA